MKFVVCVKQVPMVSSLEFDLTTKTLKREGVKLEVSSFDIRALLKAVGLKAARGGEVVVLTMGPPQARAALEHCLALGADRAVHLNDRAFAGSDTLATARALALALRREEFDLIFCGKCSTDAETAQVGPEVAELLGIPQITAVRALDLDAAGRTIRAERETDAGYETVECPLPALITAAEDLAPERFPTRKERTEAAEKPIREVTALDLSDDLSQFGVQGSPTEVAGIEIVEVSRERRLIEGEPLQARVDELTRILVERGLFRAEEPGSASSQPRAPRRATPPSPERSIWVLAEVLGGEIRPVTFELLGKSVELADKSGGEVTAVLIGHDVKAHLPLLAAHGADRVYVAADPRLDPYVTEAHAAILAQAIQRHRPRALLVPSTFYGRDLAPRVAARLGLGLTGDCIDLGLDENGRLVQYKPAFGGNIVAPILSRTSPEMATVRPGMLDAIKPVEGRRAEIEELPLDGLGEIRTRVIAQSPGEAVEAAKLDRARVVIGVGKGIGGPETLAVIEKLASVLDAAIAATRDVTDLGWLPRHHQVGLTGRAIAPAFYFAIGLRGASEHMVGVRKAGTIIAINNNPKAPVLNGADLALLGDYGEVVPLLTQALSRSKPEP